MLDYVVKLTKEPGSMVEADVQTLRDAVQVAGYYAYVNRLADGLGVELESIGDEKKPVH